MALFLAFSCWLPVCWTCCARNPSKKRKKQLKKATLVQVHGQENVAGVETVSETDKQEPQDDPEGVETVSETDKQEPQDDPEAEEEERQ